MIYLGIDPGMNGAVAALGETAPETHDMPATLSEALEVLRLYAPSECDLATGTIRTWAFVEKLHAMPKNGSIANWKLGHSCGAIEMALTALQIPWESVSPMVWQKGTGCPDTRGKKIPYEKRKAGLRAVAQGMFGAIATKKTADALLIAEFCRRNKK
jgi:hypothetical protein